MARFLELVVFDYSVLTTAQKKDVPELVELFDWLRSLDIKIYAVSTYPRALNQELAKMGLRPVDGVITKSDVDGKEKGAPEYLWTAAEWADAPPHKMLYIGDETRDWYMAGHAAVMYLHAEWAESVRLRKLQKNVTAVGASSPLFVRRFISHFILPGPRWEYSLDRESEGLHLRSLLSSQRRLASTSPSTFTLQDVFTYDKTIQVGKRPTDGRPFLAHDILMFHALSSLYTEGLIEPGFRYTFYPSSKVANRGGIIEKWLEPASRLFKGYFRDELLLRHTDAVDMSIERVNKRHDNATLLTQFNSVRVSKEQAGKLKGRTVVVFDDFTTEGFSFECARLLLRKAGAEKVICVTAGKYGGHYQVQSTKGTFNALDPFVASKHEASMFTATSVQVPRNPASGDLVSESLDHWCRDEDNLHFAEDGDEAGDYDEWIDGQD